MNDDINYCEETSDIYGCKQLFGDSTACSSPTECQLPSVKEIAELVEFLLISLHC